MGIELVGLRYGAIGTREDGRRGWNGMANMPLMILQKIQEAILFADIGVMLWVEGWDWTGSDMK